MTSLSAMTGQGMWVTNQLLSFAVMYGSYAYARETPTARKRLSGHDCSELLASELVSKGPEIASKEAMLNVWTPRPPHSGTMVASTMWRALDVMARTKHAGKAGTDRGIK